MLLKSHKTRVIVVLKTVFLVLISNTVWAQTFEPVINKPFGITSVVEDVKPVFVDIDKDGDYDLFYGTDSIVLYQENIGNKESPQFTTIIENPFNISNNVGNYCRPFFVDLDNDQDFDLLIGEGSGKVYFLQNIGTATSPNFTTPILNPFNITTGGDDARLSLVDIDDDGDYDLFLGVGIAKNILYQENIGTSSAPNFSTAQNNPFNITVVGSYPGPSLGDIDGDEDYDLLVGVQGSEVFYFKNIGTKTNPSFDNVVENAFNLDTLVDGLGCPYFVDIDNDNDQDIFIGTFEGSILYHKNTISHTSINDIDPAFLISVLPNPTTEKIQISTNLILQKIEILDIKASCVRTLPPSQSIDLNGLPKGIYFVKFYSLNSNPVIKKIEVQ